MAPGFSGVRKNLSKTVVLKNVTDAIKGADAGGACCKTQGIDSRLDS